MNTSVVSNDICCDKKSIIHHECEHVDFVELCKDIPNENIIIKHNYIDPKIKCTIIKIDSENIPRKLIDIRNDYLLYYDNNAIIIVEKIGNKIIIESYTLKTDDSNDCGRTINAIFHCDPRIDLENSKLLSYNNIYCLRTEFCKYFLYSDQAYIKKWFGNCLTQTNIICTCNIKNNIIVKKRCTDDLYMYYDCFQKLINTNENIDIINFIGWQKQSDDNSLMAIELTQKHTYMYVKYYGYFRSLLEMFIGDIYLNEKYTEYFITKRKFILDQHE